MPGNLALRYTVFVQKQGTDAAGANAVGSPDSRLTIAAALADLAANYPTASATAPHIVAIGPGTYQEAGLVLPPFTFINGECDGEGQPTTFINLTASLTLSAAWSVNATKFGGLQNLTIRAASGTPILDFTMPVPAAGNPSRTLTLENVRHNLTSMVFEATSTADAWRITECTQDGILTDTISQIGGASSFRNLASAAAITIRDKTSFAASGVWRLVSTGTGAGITANSVAAAGCTLRLTASNPRTLVLSETAPGVIAVSADSASIPTITNVSYTGTAAASDLLRISDAYGEGYTPTVPASWPANTDTVQKALDALASGTGGLAANGEVNLTTNTTGDSTATPTAQNFTVKITIGGAARTTNLITALPANPTAGDVVIWLVTLPATAAIVLNLRNATAAGTILATYTTDAVNLAWLARLEYSGATSAWTLVEAMALPGFSAILVTKSSANVVDTIAAINAPVTTDFTTRAGSSGATSVLGQGTNGSITLTPKGTGQVDIVTQAVDGENNALRLIHGTSTVNNVINLRFLPRGSGQGGSVIKASGFSGPGSNLRFFVLMSNSVETESFVMTNNQNFLVGTTTDISGSKGLAVSGSTSSTTPLTGTAIIGSGTAATNVGIGAGRITAGQTLFVLSGTNQKANTFVMVGGTATVANTSVTANSVINITIKTVSGAHLDTFTVTPTAGVGFAITAGAATDNGTYNYVILEVN